jgi:serine protease Do
MIDSAIKSCRRILLVLALTCVAGPAAAQQVGELAPPDVEKADQLRQDLRRMIGLARDRVFPALVNIRVITVQYWDGKEHKGAAGGSGTIISADGHVLTNYHVVHNGRSFKCTLSDKQEVSADLVGEDPLTDLAVLRLRLSELRSPDKAIPSAELGDSDQLEIGDTVMAMGSPWALARSVTLGIVSNTDRILSGDDDDAGEMQLGEDQRTGIFNRWIQHDAAINPGNSGGPLVNLRGEVIGVNARGQSMGGDMGFAIPSNLARYVAAQLIEHGEVPRSDIGLSFKPIKKTGLDEGVLVNSLVTDGKPITVRFPEQVPPLLKQIAEQPLGSTIEFTYQRDGQTRTASVVTEKLRKDRGDEAAFRAWGLTGIDITEKMARERRLDSSDGVLVSSIGSGSPAQQAEPALMPGDVIRSVAGEPVENLDAFIARYRQIMESEKKPEYIMLEYDRAGESQVTLLKPKRDEDFDPPREVPKAWIGVAVQPVLKQLAEQLGHPDALGFRVTRVYPRTKAADADLKVGDIILGVDGERLRPRGMQDAGLFHRFIRRLDTDAQATLSLMRDGESTQIVVPLERTRLTPAETRKDHNSDFELTVREVTFFDRVDARWSDDVKGVLVSDVERAGWTGQGGIWPGDLIQRIDEFEIQGIEDYRKAMEAVTKRKPDRVVFVVLRGVHSRFEYVEPEWKPVASDEEVDEG